jgi:hypothetical protein
LMVDRAILNFSFLGETGLKITLRAPDPVDGAAEADVAIAPVPDQYWSMLTSRKGKAAIDLDNWREPLWSATLGYAAGYMDEHKSLTELGGAEKVASPMLSATAEVANTIGPDRDFIVLQSRLAAAPALFFSGISGGPLYLISSQGELMPAGIIFEGYPSTKTEAEARSADSFLDERDIFFRALTLTPERFAEWLK